MFDFEASSVLSDELKPQGLIKKEGKTTYTLGEDSKMYETRVVVRRLQNGILPVDLLLKFENGEEFRDVWDAKNTWRLYTLVKQVKLLYAAVDPERKILLDIDYTNNSRLLQPQPGFEAAKGTTIEIGRRVVATPKLLRTLQRTDFKGTLALAYEKDAKDPLPGAAESIGYLRGVLAAI